MVPSSLRATAAPPQEEGTVMDQKTVPDNFKVESRAYRDAADPAAPQYAIGETSPMDSSE